MGNSKNNQKSSDGKYLERLIPTNIPFYRKNLFLEHFLRYRFASEFVKNKTVLDVACGTGFGSYFLIKSGAKKIFAIDNDAQTIGYAKSTYADKNIDYLLADAQKIPLKNNSVDVVVSFETIEHVKEPELFLNEIQRILKPNGLLILSTPNRQTSYEDNPFHLKEFTFGELQTILNNFKEETFYGQRKVSKKIIAVYKLLFKQFKLLRFFLRFRPWENPGIYKMKNNNDIFCLYLIVVCKK
jgi:ubiquinone/menaquinone biosynthesis C-methylase UbiE